MTRRNLHNARAIALLVPLIGFGVTSSEATAQVMTKQVADNEITETAVQYLDDLKECAVGSQNPPMPLPFLDGAMAISEIIGQEDGNCVVETIVFLATDPDNQTTLSYCEHTPATLAVMTDETAYEQARTGNYSFSTDSDRDAALSTAMEAECDLNFEWFDELSAPTS